jgi:serine/threonine-protein kinase
MRITTSTVTVPNGQGGPLALAEPVVDEDLPSGSACGEYIVERKIGEGGMGAVYGARHPLIGKRAAIKVIKRDLSVNPEAVDRFVREAQAVNTIGHPNIVDVFGFGRLPDGRSFFVMEWLEGEALRARMTRPLAFAQALEVLESIAVALRAAHEAGVVHRDLKPDNVYLARSKGAPAPRVKLLDFGLAKLSGPTGDGRVDHTRTGIVMGTPLYLSPEQAKGIKIDFATDVYSLGVIAYEMAAGAVPFTADSAVEIMAAHISARPVPLHERAPWVPQMFDRLVMRMLDKDPQARPPIREVEEQLAMMRAQPEIANAAPVAGGVAAQWTPSPSLAAVPPVTQIGATRKRRGVVIGIVAAVVIAGGAMAVLALGGGSDKPKQEVAAIAPAPAPVPVKPEPVKPEPAKPEPVAPEPVKPEPVATVPPEPAKPEPAKPEPAKHLAAKPGTLAITIAGAQKGNVLVDGKRVGSNVATISIELAPGEHRVRVEAPGHRPVQHVVRVEAGANQPMSIQLGAKSIDTIHDPFAE